MLRLNDDDFVIDKIVFDERKSPTPVKISDDDENYDDYVQDDEEFWFHYSNFVIQKQTRPNLGAISVNWPYIAFSGLSNYFFILNIFDRKIV